MELKTILIIFAILLLIGGSAFYFSRNTGMVGKFTEAAGFDGAEKDCSDSVDNDNDGLADCLDPDCENIKCDTTGGCLCVSGQKCEMRDWDNKDNDNDGLVDETEGQECALS